MQPSFAVFVDGTPSLISIDELRQMLGTPAPAVGVTHDDLAAVVGNAREVARHVDLNLGHAFEQIIPIAEAVELLEERVGPIERLPALEDAAKLLDRQVADFGAIGRQATRDVARLAEAGLGAVLGDASLRVFLLDAGLDTDPATGRGRFYALQETRERQSLVEVALDAVRGTIELRATYDEVRDIVARAALDPSQIAELDHIIRQLNEARIDIDAQGASLRLKADAITVRALGGDVREVSQLLDALTGVVETKASLTIVERQELRLSAAEQRLETLPDGAAFSVAVRQARRSIDDATLAGLAGVLADARAGESQYRAVSEARQELGARITEAGEAISRAEQRLGARVGSAEAQAVREEEARVAGDRAEAAARSALGARLDGVGRDLAAQVLRLDRAIVDGDEVIAEAAAQVRAEADGNLTAEARRLDRARITGDQASAALIEQVETQLGDRLGQAEQRLEALPDGASFSVTVRQARRAADDATIAGLAGVVAGARADEARYREVAEARQELGARVTETGEAVTAAKLLLGAEIGGLAARAGREEAARASADRAEASARAALGASMEGLGRDLAAQVLRLDRAIVDGDDASAETAQQVRADLDRKVDNVGRDVDDLAAATQEALDTRISAEVARTDRAIASAAAAQASSTQQLGARVDANSAAIVRQDKVLATPTGASAVSINATDVNGRIIGTKSANDGELGRYSIASDIFEVVHPITGELLWYVDNNNAIVGKLKAKSIETEQLANGANGRTTVWITTEDVVIPTSS